MFQNVEGPFGVVSVAGLYRTGKSYLLNKVLLNRQPGESGFGVGPSINPCTKVGLNKLNIHRVSGYGVAQSLDSIHKAKQST